MDCQVCIAGGNLWVAVEGGDENDDVGRLSYDGEHDLALMVRDFWESGSDGAESRCASDSDSSLSDISHLTDKILSFKHSVTQSESDLLSVVHSLMLSINEMDLHFVKSGSCNASCIRFYLAKLLRHSGYDAAVCSSRWQGNGKVPGGDHEYIDMLRHDSSTGSERLIIDVDFRSHFEIARAVESYDRMLDMIPPIYVGSLNRLKQFLQVMVEAARSSLKQNSMPFPPWRSLAYLQAKWQSPYQRMIHPKEHKKSKTNSQDHKQCRDHLKRLHSLLQSERAEEQFLKPDEWQ